MQVWKLIPNHEHPEEAFELFRERGIIAVGWTDVGDLRLRSPKSKSEITHWIQHAYPNLKNAHLGGPSLWNFLREAREGDYVLVSSQGRRYGVFEVLDAYEFSTESKAVLGYRHVRRAEFTGIDAEELWAACGRQAAPGHAVRWTMCLLTHTDEVAQRVYEEGRRYSTISTAVERNPNARASCLKHHGTVCIVCGFSGEKSFGAAGKDLIHVHHLTEVASKSGIYNVDPVQDLVPLCPTCHSMAHRRKPAYTIDELRQLAIDASH